MFHLILQVLLETDIPRIRLASVEPWDLPESFLTLFSNNKLMPHMHLPLQSGSDSVLRRMARRCKTNDFRTLVSTLRNEIENFNLTSDIIVGFPGETKEEWQESLEFIEEIGFSHIHIFTYSSREGTKAATLPNAVAPDIKKKRSRELHMLAGKMRHQFLSQYIGQIHSVLWESQNNNKWVGYTDNFIRVEMNTPCTENLENRISDVRVTGLNNHADQCIVELL